MFRSRRYLRREWITTVNKVGKRVNSAIRECAARATKQGEVSISSWNCMPSWLSWTAVASEVQKFKLRHHQTALRVTGSLGRRSEPLWAWRYIILIRLGDVASLFLDTALAVAPLLNQSKISSLVRSFFWRHLPQCLSPMTACPIWLRNRWFNSPFQARCGVKVLRLGTVAAAFPKTTMRDQGHGW